MAMSRVSFKVGTERQASRVILMDRTECERLGEKTCVLWSTAGYAAQLSLVPCLAALISLLFIFLHRGECWPWPVGVEADVKDIVEQERKRGDSNGS